MRKAEISKIIHKEEKTIEKAIIKASESNSDFLKKISNGRSIPGIEFTLDEVKTIYSILGCNKLQFILLEENWIEKPQKDIYTIKGTQKFIKEFEANPKIMCCNTCKYLRGKSSYSEMPKPFCSLYQKKLESFNAKVYEDYCNSYEYIKFPKPRQWFKDSAPANLDMFGDTDTINGIKREKYNGIRKRNEPIRYISKDLVGFSI